MPAEVRRGHWIPMKLEFQVIKRYLMLVLGSHYRTSLRVEFTRILIRYPTSFKSLKKNTDMAKIHTHKYSHGQSSTHHNLIRFLLWKLKGVLHILKSRKGEKHKTRKCKGGKIIFCPQFRCLIENAINKRWET